MTPKPKPPVLIGELAGSHPGPIIVVGGGPSAPASLAALSRLGIRPSAVLSANEHGFKQSTFPVTHSVCCDPTHGVTGDRMDNLLKRHGVPLITPCWFGDARLPDWDLACNTGLTAIVVALVLGARPVIPVGIDFYRLDDPAAATYFHSAGAHSNSLTKTADNFRKQITALERRIGRHAPVRPMAGRLLERWPAFDPDEDVESYWPTPMLSQMLDEPTILVQTHPIRRIAFGYASRVPTSSIIAVSRREARALVNARDARFLDREAVGA